MDPDVDVRAQPDVQPPAVPRHQRHGPRRRFDDDLRLARARRGAALLPAGHRVADEPQLRAPRRRRRRPTGRLARRCAAPARPHSAAPRRVRHVDDRPADLARATAGRRCHHTDGSDRAGGHRSDAALDRRGVRHPPRRAVPALRRRRFRRHRRIVWRCLRPLRHSHQRGARVDAPRPPDPRQDAGR